MAKVCSLFSGSSGNSTYISCSEGGILVAAGVSAKAITEALQWHDVAVNTIRAIFVTHEHGDHVSGIRVFASRYHIPVYVSAGTAQALEDMGTLQGKVEVHTLDCEHAAQAAGMEIRSFPTYHDCRELHQNTGALHPYHFEVLRRRLSDAELPSHADAFHHDACLCNQHL